MIKSILYKFLVNLLKFAFISTYIAFYIFDKVLVFNKIFAINQ